MMKIFIVVIGKKTVILAGKFTLNELKSQLSGINPGDLLEN